jgi:hypothetical protein
MFVIGVTKYSIGGAPLFYPIPFSHKKVYTADKPESLQANKLASAQAVNLLLGSDQAN